MKPYLSPPVVQSGGQGMTRKADKTGLISSQSNKYSVPMAYQRASVRVVETDQQLHIFDLESGEPIAQHGLSGGKGQIIKNTHHYRDLQARVEQLERQLTEQIGEMASADCPKCSKPVRPGSTKISLSV